MQGVRRSGKSIFIKTNYKKLDIEKESFYVNFEDPCLSDILDYKTSTLSLPFMKVKIQTVLLLFDEIQNVKGWEKWPHIQVAKTKIFCYYRIKFKIAGRELGTV